LNVKKKYTNLVIIGIICYKLFIINVRKGFNRKYINDACLGNSLVS